jgi:hypothetical protein
MIAVTQLLGSPPRARRRSRAVSIVMVPAGASSFRPSGNADMLSPALSTYQVGLVGYRRLAVGIGFVVSPCAARQTDEKTSYPDCRATPMQQISVQTRNVWVLEALCGARLSILTTNWSALPASHIPISAMRIAPSTFRALLTISSSKPRMLIIRSWVFSSSILRVAVKRKPTARRRKSQRQL